MARRFGGCGNDETRLPLEATEVLPMDTIPEL